MVTAISGMRARSAKQPGRSKPITGPTRHSALRSVRHKRHAPHGSFARAATRSPTFTRVTPDPTSSTLAQNSCPNSWTGASVSSRRLTRSYASVGMPCASCASVTLGCTQSGSTMTCPAPQAGSGTSSSRRSPNAWNRQAFMGVAFVGAACRAALLPNSDRFRKLRCVPERAIACRPAGGTYFKNFCSAWQSGGTSPRLPPADHVTSDT